MNKLNSIADSCWDEICKNSSTTYFEYTGPTDNNGYYMENGIKKFKYGYIVSPSLMKQCYQNNKNLICNCCKQRGSANDCCSYVDQETISFCGSPCAGNNDDGNVTKYNPTEIGPNISTKTPEQEPTRTPEQEPTRTPKQEPTRTPEQEPTRTPEQKPTRTPEQEPEQNVDLWPIIIGFIIFLFIVIFVVCGIILLNKKNKYNKI